MIYFIPGSKGHFVKDKISDRSGCKCKNDAYPEEAPKSSGESAISDLGGRKYLKFDKKIKNSIPELNNLNKEAYH